MNGDDSAQSPTDFATGGAHGMTSPLRLDHASVLGWLMIAALLFLGLLHFTFGVRFGVGR